jgi:uroporphyrinogen-III synthase/uroporphyrinogen III methyltransferase/synthase
VSSLQLAGKRVLVTRALHQAGKLSDGLRALGAVPVEVPVLEIQPPASFDALDSALRNLDSYDWLILTSANTVRALAERAAHLGILLEGSFQKTANGVELSSSPCLFPGAGQPATCGGADSKGSSLQVAAIGEATAAAVRKTGIQITFVPESYVAESLIEGMLAGRQNGVEGQRILLARAAVARDVIPDALRAAGAVVDVIDAYRNVLPESAPGLLRNAIAEGLDAATFTSSSSVSHLAEAAQAAGVVFPFAGIPAVSIGPITSQSLRDQGWEPAAEANPSDIPGLIVAVERVLRA